MAGAFLANEFGETGNEAVADGEGSLWRDVAGGEAGTAGGEDKSGAAGGGAESGGEEGSLVGNEEDVEHMGAGFGEQAGECGAGEVSLCAGEAPVTDGDDDGGARCKCGWVWHVSRIDACARNTAGDEKMGRPASFWSGDLLRQAQPSPCLIRHRLKHFSCHRKLDEA